MPTEIYKGLLSLRELGKQVNVITFQVTKDSLNKKSINLEGKDKEGFEYVALFMPKGPYKYTIKDDIEGFQRYVNLFGP